MDRVRHARVALTVLTLAALLTVIYVLLPFLHSIILALLLASLFHPVHARLKARLGRRENLAALLSVVIVFLVVVIPASLFVTALARQGLETYARAKEWLAPERIKAVMASERVQSLLQHEHVGRLLELAKLEPEQLASGTVTMPELNLDGALIDFATRMVGRGGQVLGAVGGTLLAFLIMLFVMFFAFRDGAGALRYIQHLSPLSTSQEEALITRVKDVTRAVLLGTVLTAVAQGVAGAVGFLFVGIAPMFWGSMLGAASMIPVVGTALIWIPASGYLLITGHPWKALFLVGWGGLVVGSIDNILRPMLMGGRTGMSSIVVFFAILGGIKAFGPVGVVYGPLLFGLCAVCFYIYEIENADLLAVQDQR